MRSRPFQFLGVWGALAGAGCAGSSGTPGGTVDGSVDAPRNEAGPAVGTGLAGTVKDRAGVIVTGAKVEGGTEVVHSDTQGKYEIALPAGLAAVKITREWFQPFEGMVSVGSAGPTAHDFTLDETPLKLDPADAALAESHARTFDWTKGTLSISVVSVPTRRDFDNAVYFRNPALYRDTSKEAPLTPMPQPTIAGGMAMNFTFEVKSGTNTGKEALDVTTIADALPQTTLSAPDRAAYMTWMPMLIWLREWDMAKAADLSAAEVAIRQQNWGGGAPRPQEIERVYLDSARGELWAEVVFAPFVQLGPGVADDDADGRKEIYARIATIHYTKELVDKLGKEYGTTRFTTHGLSKEVTKSLNSLYTLTTAQVERRIGEPYEIPGVGTIKYPFVVVRHGGGQKNVFLVAPSP